MEVVAGTCGIHGCNLRALALSRSSTGNTRRAEKSPGREVLGSRPISLNQEAPRFANTAEIVFHKICRSRLSDQFST